MDSPASYPPNAIIRRLARSTQAGRKFGPCRMPGALASVELRFAARALARSEQSKTYFIEAEAGKDILKHGLQQMSDNAIEKATLAKQASCENRRLRVMLTAWEIEEAECHAELLCVLQRSNMEGYWDSTHKATWFEKFLSDRSLAEIKDDFNFDTTVYPNNFALLATTDEQLNQFESHAEQRDLILSKEELRRELKTLIAEGGKGSGSDGTHVSNTPDDC
ncbi:hypothetical protein BDR03DRAFT_987876 [Suillus americanus]|nr:hypothetical protein BDR03DRAFT_987876 [Suillus americanus]